MDGAGLLGAVIIVFVLVGFALSSANSDPDE